MELKHKLKQSFSQDNNGASLITVIITMGFLSVLASILISAAVINYQMKQLDARNKKDFYTVETVLDDVYNGLGRDMTNAIAQAYESALTKPYTGDSYQQESEAYAQFATLFRANFLALYGLDSDSSQYADINKTENREALAAQLSDYITVATGDRAEVQSIGELYITTDNKMIRLNDTVVTYWNDTMDTTASITTDIVLTVPTIRFFISHEYIWDYAIIGNEGVNVQSASGTTIQGNLYAGTQDSGVGGLTLENTVFNFSGEMLVTSSDMTQTASTSIISGLSSTSKANIWATNIMIEGSSNLLDVWGSTFLADDLQLDGTSSDITFSGDFYGYSNNSIVTGADSTHSTSSSIIVNGKSNTIDLSELDLLILAGRSYIDFASEGYSGADSGDHEYATGEGLALQTNQFIYLVPTQFLSTTNPVYHTQAQSFDASNPDFVSWFGYQYLDDSNPVRIETVTYTGTGTDKFTYYFLNFKSNEACINYVNFILSSTAWDVQEMKATLDERAGNLLASELSLGDCTVYSNFAIMEYDNINGTIDQTTTSSSSLIKANTYAEVLGTRYEYVWKTLDPMTSIALEDKVEYEVDSGLIMGTDLPLGNYINLASGFNGGATLTKTYGSYEVEIYTGNITISAGDLYQGVILVDGDVTLSGVNIEGIVMATGTITLENGARVTANREIVKTIIETELQEVTELGITTADDAYKNYFISYLKDPKYNDEDTVYGNDIIGTDYAQFITYENWEKGDLS